MPKTVPESKFVELEGLDRISANPPAKSNSVSGTSTIPQTSSSNLTSIE